MQRAMKRFGSATLAVVFLSVAGVGLLSCAKSSGTNCGNGFRDGDEACDGLDLYGMDCQSLGLGLGPLKCTQSCTFDTTACSASSNCGNGFREGAEFCDGADLGGQSCESLNLGPGLLACGASCEFDTTNCQQGAVCGNGVVEGVEQCDGFNLDGKNCASPEVGFAGGSLSCVAASCTFDTSGCTTGSVCGNSLQEGTEECDGADLHGVTCVSLGYAGGQLSCNANCTRNTAGCTQTAEVCDNGVDDDSDGFVDCNDGDCFSSPACGGSPENCSNGVDDDQDGQIDCDDLDCNGSPSCTTTGEICDNGVDDDGNFLCDCNDIFACLFDFACLLAPTVETNCTDGQDDDLDCDVDCDDSDCAADPACGGLAEICDNGIDDDSDGDVDCADADCAGHASCPTCTPQTTISCGDTLGGDTSSGLPNITAYGCGAYNDSGPEAYFVFSHTSGGAVTIDLVGTGGADLELLLVGASGGDCDYQNSCLEYSQQSGGTEQIQFTAAAGSSYFIIVDGYSNAAGPFNLTVTCP
ncbi:MAG: hypothetical protein ABI333_12115 [bacterium]